MNNLKQASISKSRGYTSCITEAHRMMFDNIREIFGRMWIYVAVLSVMSALTASLYTNRLLHGGSVALDVALGVASLLALSAEVVYFARVLYLVNGRPMRWNITRSAVLTACYVITIFVCTLAFTFATYGMVMTGRVTTVDKFQPLFVAFGALYAVIYLLMIPCVYVAMEYMMEPEVRLRKTIFRSYVTGLRHWGLLFTALFITVLCAAVCSALVSIPALIVIVANVYSVLGVNFLGDPAGLPSYFGVLQFVVFALSSFICLFINIFVVFVCYFLYGSIKTREKEKKEFDKSEALSLAESV